PKKVLEIALQIETENIRVHEDINDAAIAMPAELAAKWVKKEIKWISRQERIFLLLPEKLGAMVVHLARGGRMETALQLARALLAVLPDPQAALKAEDEPYHLLRPEPRARFDVWDYHEILQNQIPQVVEIAGERALSALCDLLDDALRLSRRRDEDTT